MTKFPEIYEALCRPFSAQEIKQREGSNKRMMKYITARSVMNRLDEVLGFENWRDEYFPSELSVRCRLTITLPDGSTVSKEDVGGYSEMKDGSDTGKSGYSDAFKRVAVKFGIGRDLYGDFLPPRSGQRPPQSGPGQHQRPNGNGSNPSTFGQGLTPASTVKPPDNRTLEELMQAASKQSKSPLFDLYRDLHALAVQAQYTADLGPDPMGTDVVDALNVVFENNRKWVRGRLVDLVTNAMQSASGSR